MKNQSEDTAILFTDKLFYIYFVEFILQVFLTVLQFSFNKTLHSNPL